MMVAKDIKFDPKYDVEELAQKLDSERERSE